MLHYHFSMLLPSRNHVYHASGFTGSRQILMTDVAESAGWSILEEVLACGSQKVVEVHSCSGYEVTYVGSVHSCYNGVMSVIMCGGTMNLKHQASYSLQLEVQPCLYMLQLKRRYFLFIDLSAGINSTSN